MLDHLKNQRGDVPQSFSLALSDLQNGVPYKKNFSLQQEKHGTW